MTLLAEDVSDLWLELVFILVPCWCSLRKQDHQCTDRRTWALALWS
uniref:Uncharacterized protein n=1 Tax=Anguilla anguilla TaxID=7936 RepID=A0A0E9PUM6_ANGAN